MTLLIDFEPIGRRGICEPGSSILNCARDLGVDLANLCGGIGDCGRCIVQVLDGEMSPIKESEREFLSGEMIQQGYRLACCTVPMGDSKIHVPAESLTTHQRIQVEGREIALESEPTVRTFQVQLSHPSLSDQRADFERLIGALAQQYDLNQIAIDPLTLRELSAYLRDMDWEANLVIRDSEIISLLPRDSRPLGLAIDLGTTKIAAYLVELETGVTLASQGILNPQIAYGEDVLTRIAYAQQELTHAQLLQNMVVEAINQLIVDLCIQVRKQPEEIVEIVIVGNTAMHHIFTGLPVRQLGRTPYVPAVSSSLDLKARELNLEIAPGGYVHMLSNIAGYVGADHVAMLLAVQIAQSEGVVLAIDIGTNTEICLSNQGALISLSTASGPAFEGAHIKHGMRAADGAIERLRLVDGQVEYQTIGNVAPVGLCGSGILDTLAQLHQSGIVNSRGRMGEHHRVRGNGEKREFVITSPGEHKTVARDIVFTQLDIQELQLAKGAIRTGIDTLLNLNGLTPNEIDQIIIAGAFGTYLDVGSTMTIGLLPKLPLKQIQQVGNAAGMGAKLALISKSKRKEAKEIASRVRYIELAADPKFSNTFAKAMRLGSF